MANVSVDEIHLLQNVVRVNEALEMLSQTLDFEGIYTRINDLHGRNDTLQVYWTVEPQHAEVQQVAAFWTNEGGIQTEHFLGPRIGQPIYTDVQRAITSSRPNALFPASEHWELLVDIQQIPEQYNLDRIWEGSEVFFRMDNRSQEPRLLVEEISHAHAHEYRVTCQVLGDGFPLAPLEYHLRHLSIIPP